MKGEHLALPTKIPLCYKYKLCKDRTKTKKAEHNPKHYLLILVAAQFSVVVRLYKSADISLLNKTLLKNKTVILVEQNSSVAC